MAVDASMAQIAAGAAEPQDGLFDAVREQAESVIAWARSGNVLAAEHHVLEERGLADAMEMARLLAQAHLDLRALREERRDDVIDSDGDRRVTCEGGRERGRVMIFGDVRTSRIAYRKRGKENLHLQDAGLSWGPRCYSAGAERRLAEAIAVMPAERAAAQVSRMGAVTVGKQQAEETAEAYAVDFEGFLADQAQAALIDGRVPARAPVRLTQVSGLLTAVQVAEQCPASQRPPPPPPASPPPTPTPAGVPPPPGR